VPDPDTYITTLDAESEKRVISVGGDDITVTLENLRITAGLTDTAIITVIVTTEADVALPVGGHTKPLSKRVSSWLWLLLAAMVATGASGAVQSLTGRKQ